MYMVAWQVRLLNQGVAPEWTPDLPSQAGQHQENQVRVQSPGPLLGQTLVARRPGQLVALALRPGPLLLRVSAGVLSQS